MPQSIQHIKLLITSVLVLVFTSINAQEVRIIDNKGTIQTVNNNNVTTSTTAPTDPVENDVWFDTSTIPNIVNIWDEDTGPSGSWLPLANNFWSLTGNSATNPTTNFLGTIDAQDLVLRAGNIEKLRLFGTKGQVLINQAPTFNNHPLVVRANGNDILAFQDAGGTPRWHWNLLGNGLNFVESNVADYRLFLQNGGNVGINTDTPTERLDVNGKLRIRDITTVTTNNDILTATNTGVVEKKKLIAAETNNQITTGANGGVYLGPTVYTGAFIINTSGSITVTTLPFQPSQITFVAHANVESFNLDSDNGVGNNNTGIANSFGTMNGFARDNDGTINQQVIYIGGSGNSINDISRFASSSNCIGLRYGNQNGNDLGKITASLTSFDANGFTINVNRTSNAINENLVVLYTAYK